MKLDIKKITLHPLKTSAIEREKWLLLARYWTEIERGPESTLYRVRVTAGFYKMAFMQEFTLLNGVIPDEDIEAQRIVHIWKAVYENAPDFFNEADIMGWVPEAALPRLIIMH